MPIPVHPRQTRQHPYASPNAPTHHVVMLRTYFPLCPVCEQPIPLNKLDGHLWGIHGVVLEKKPHKERITK
jgi:hypothetical protein